MPQCPACGEQNPEGSRYCSACGTALTVEPAVEERKIVSVLFVDLVGFTAASERADPEDVRARLQRYHARARAEIERFGGTVEKFVGDAVMAVFGAPVAHEDDGERAVRAGLAVLETMHELELEARAAVNTGEAVVALDARPERGEGVVTGDVVNTAARLQSSAPAGSLVVGEQTYWATRHAIEYAELDAVVAKGKTEPVPVWRAVGARSRLGVDLDPGHRTPFLGRDDELDVLRQIYARTLRESACHLVTLVGEPGIGKSRLVAELRQFVDSQAELVYWRQGRCLPYGDGIALWALGEIVKAHAGVLESDDPATVRAKLTETLQPLVPSTSEQAWIAAELGRLVGLGESGGEREQSFAAWRQFLEAVAAQRPLVLVVEDLHWADATLLEFLEHLVDWSSGVPLLVLCTARPELHELHPAWSGGKRNATTISLSPLSSADTARLIAALLDRAVLPAETQQALLERAGGNPLYAEQFVRMLQERPADDRVAVPETVQALIAARLDTLGGERKALIQNAAVVGKVFWSGAVASVGGVEERAVREGLHELVRRDLVRRSRLSTVEGQAELAFGHGLVRDVAYAQIPRAARVGKHEAAAAWIEGVAGERVADHAELLAHHYREALALAVAAGLESGQLEERTRRFLALAAQRAAVVDARRAAALFEEALELAPPGHPARGPILLASIEFVGQAGERDRERITEAIAELQAVGDEVGVGKATILRSQLHWLRGDTTEAERLIREAITVLERHDPGPELAHGYALMGGRLVIAGRPEESLEWTRRAIELARRLGLENFAERARQAQGLARFYMGDPGGLDDLRESLRVSLERGLTREAEIGYNNYGSVLFMTEGPEHALPVYQDSVDFYERRGRPASWSRGEMTWVLFDLGRWDELLEVAALVEAEAADGVGGQPLLMALASKGRVFFHRGRLDEAEAISADLLAPARSAGDPQIVVPTLSLAVVVERDPARALELAQELLEVEAPENPLHPEVARACVRHGALNLVERMIRTDDRVPPRTRHVIATIRAIVAEARGEAAEAAPLYADAAERWERHPFVLERAQCLLGLARTAADAESAREAKQLFSALGAKALEHEADAALAAALPLSS